MNAIASENPMRSAVGRRHPAQASCDRRPYELPVQDPDFELAAAHDIPATAPRVTPPLEVEAKVTHPADELSLVEPDLREPLIQTDVAQMKVG